MNIHSPKAMACPSNLTCLGSDFLLEEPRVGKMGTLLTGLLCHTWLCTHVPAPTSSLYHSQASQPSGNNHRLLGESSLIDTCVLLYTTCKVDIQS